MVSPVFTVPPMSPVVIPPPLRVDRGRSPRVKSGVPVDLGLSLSEMGRPPVVRCWARWVERRRSLCLWG